MYGVIPSPPPDTSSIVTKIGGEEHQVTTVESHDLVVLVSPLPSADKLKATRKNLIAHQRVLEEVLASHTLLPLRFGIAADNAQQVQDLMARNAESIKSQLNALEGKVEMSLKAMWKDMQAVFQEIVADNAQIQRQREKAAKGKLSHDGQIELGKQVEQALREKQDKQQEEMLSGLRPLAEEVAVQEPIGDNMCLNAAFLIRREQEPAFDEAVNALGDRYEGQMDFKYVGPLPVYNFITLDLQWEGQPQ